MHALRLFIVSSFVLAYLSAANEPKFPSLRRHRRELYYNIETTTNTDINENDAGLSSEDAFLIGRMLEDVYMSSSDGSGACDAQSCPCCDRSTWPEFVAAVDRYQGTDSCYFRQDDDNSNIIALDLCETSALAGFESGLTAYMSIDYANRGGKPSKPVYYCGGSGSDVEFLNESQGQACAEIIGNKVEEETGVCNDVFQCTYDF